MMLSLGIHMSKSKKYQRTRNVSFMFEGIGSGSGGWFTLLCSLKGLGTVGRKHPQVYVSNEIPPT